MEFILELAIDSVGDLLGDLSMPLWDKLRSKYLQWKQRRHTDQ